MSLGNSKRVRRVVLGLASQSQPDPCARFGLVAAIVRIREKNPRLADQLATDYTRAEITERQIAMLDFAILVADQAAEVSNEDIDTLTEYGFSKDDIWDVGVIAAFFALSNRMAGLTDMLPNEEFYSLGER